MHDRVKDPFFLSELVDLTHLTTISTAVQKFIILNQKESSLNLCFVSNTNLAYFSSRRSFFIDGVTSERNPTGEKLERKNKKLSCAFVVPHNLKIHRK